MTTTIHSCRHKWTGKRITHNGTQEITISPGGSESLSDHTIILNLPENFYDMEEDQDDCILLVIDSHNNEVCVDAAVDDPEDTGAPIAESPADYHQVLLIRTGDLDNCENGLRIRDGGFWKETNTE